MTTTTNSVLVIYVDADGKSWQEHVPFEAGMTVGQTIEFSGFQGQYPDVDWQAGGIGIFGKRAKPSELVCASDRIEIYRALVFDPKESRRRRALHRQRQKQTGGKQRGR